MPVLTQRYSPIAPAAPTPAPAAPAPAPALKKVSLAGFAKKKESGTKTEYPSFPDPTGKAHETAATIREMQEQYEALDGSLKAHKKFLIDMVAPWHFTENQGKPDPAKAVIVQGGIRKEDGTLEMIDAKVRIDFKQKYPVLEDESSLVPIVGDQLGVWFRQKFSLTIDGDKLPADRVEDLLGELQRLFAEFHATDALTVKSGYSPVDEFHVRRHTAFTPEQNLELQRVCPIQAACATKNVK